MWLLQVSHSFCWGRTIQRRLLPVSAISRGSRHSILVHFLPVNGRNSREHGQAEILTRISLNSLLMHSFAKKSLPSITYPGFEKVRSARTAMDSGDTCTTIQLESIFCAMHSLPS